MSKKQQSVPRRRLINEPEPQRATAAELDARYTFRRNRTLTGSLSSRVDSAVALTAELKSSRVHSHHLRHHRRLALVSLLALIAAAAGLWLLISHAIIGVKLLPGGGAQLVDTSAYQSKIHDYLMKHPLERFTFSLNTGSLTSYLQSHDMPEVGTISPGIETAGFGQANLYINFRKPVVVWQTAGTKLYVDSDGNSFGRNYYAEPGVQVVDQTGIQAQGNQVLASNRFLSFIGVVVGQMKDNGFTVTEIALPANTTRQIQVKLDSVSYPIKFSVDRPAGEQAEDAARAIKHLQAKGVSAEYIDVRVSGRAYYK